MKRLFPGVALARLSSNQTSSKPFTGGVELIGLTYIGPTLTAMPTDLMRTPMPIGLIAITVPCGDCVDAR
jgi:hypothetical protein